MCKSSSSKGNGSSTIATILFNLVVDAVIFAYIIAFLFFRLGELIPLGERYPNQCLSILIGTVVISFSSSLGRASKRIFYLLSVLGFIYLADFYLPKPLPPASDVHSGKTVVVTGANSGVGYETARQLAVKYRMNVIMGCRSKSKCDVAAKAINDEIASAGTNGIEKNEAIPMVVDLANFQSVNTFVGQLKGMDIAVLVNNAGYVPVADIPANQYGLDPSFTSMHLSHFLLTEELLEQNPSLRVVITSSIGHHFCSLPFHFPKLVLSVGQFAPLPPCITSIFALPHNPGCVDEDYLSNKINKATEDSSYIHVKTANMMHAVEIPQRHPKSTSVAIDLGWVGTHILSLMEGNLLNPTSLGLMRNAEVGVIPFLHAVLSSDDELLHGSFEDNRQWADGGVVINSLGQTGEAFSYPWFHESINTTRSRMLHLSRALWKVSDKLIRLHANNNMEESRSE